MSEEERRARQGLASQVKSKSEKEVYNLEAKESSGPTMNELNDLRNQVDELTKFVAELKKENSLLKEMESPCPDYLQQMEEKNELENLLNLLQCELDTCRLTKAEDCDQLRREIDQLKHQNCELKTLVNCYSERLDLEKNSGPHEENRLRSEITHLRCDVIELCKKIEDLEAQLLKKCLEIKCLKQCCDNLEKKNDNLEMEVNRRESESEGLKTEVSKLILEQRRLSTDNESLKSRLKESESPKTRGPQEDLEKDLSEKKEIDKTMKILEDHVDGLSQKLEDGNDLSGLLKKQKDMEDELERLRKQLNECKENEQAKSELSKAAGTKDLAGQAGKPMKDSVTQTDAVKAVDTKVADTQTEEMKELGTAKQEGVAYPTPKQAQAVPQMMIPIREEERPATYERGRPVEVTQAHPGSKVAFIETQPKELKVVVDPKQEQTKKGKYDQADGGPAKPSKTVLPQASKTATSPSKAALSQQSRGKAKPAVSEPAFKSMGSDESIGSFSDLDPDFSKFLCSLNPDNHRENICLIEKRYREKMSELQSKNEEKVKTLLKQFENESNMKDKMFKDNINSIKSGYETDIRKLTDRHRASIMQLQSLHEEEIQELNATFETEMDALHSQNENIVNNITEGAAEKFKMLAEQHNKEIRNLEKKYQKLLEQKEMKHLEAVSASGTGEASLEDMQMKHNRQLKKLKESNLKRVDLVRHKYEDLISCERKKYEKKLEDLVQRLKQGKKDGGGESGAVVSSSAALELFFRDSHANISRFFIAGKAVADGICQCRMMPPCQKDPNVPLEFNDVLRKILTFGLEASTLSCSAK